MTVDFISGGGTAAPARWSIAGDEDDHGQDIFRQPEPLLDASSDAASFLQHDAVSYFYDFIF